MGPVARLPRDYIARELCVNRSRSQLKSTPQLKCNGRCHLAKELKIVARTERRQQSDNRQAFQEIILFCTPFAALGVVPPGHRPATPRSVALQIGSYHWHRPRSSTRA
ncbi:hypothetical protein [Hymenobacter rigui]|uniref:Uncharacterized protein n=1 Tax=Hymenobacter rigui TaxID=334424 RepID=A0A3R9MSM8_9BACT|nr:hypothetical protein [Hymenobacter rigui]RSK47508.1 hypothetical protein EI291_14715 [Hymenobacter rigui]